MYRQKKQSLNSNSPPPKTIGDGESSNRSPDPAVTLPTQGQAPSDGTDKKISYFFSAEGRDLSCTINAHPLSLHFTTMLCDILYVFGGLNHCQPKITIDFKASTLKIIFHNINQSDAFDSIIRFIHQLKEMGIAEWHENKNALWFYSNSGSEILNVHNYPKTLQEFLKNEFTAVSTILRKHSTMYTTLVEIGCGYMVNLELAKQEHLHYLGIDFSPAAIRSATLEIERNPQKYENVRVACLDLFEIDRHPKLFKENERPIFLLPFNLFGNIAPISLLLARLQKFQAHLLISIYKTDEPTNRVRHDYYSNCGYKELNHRTDHTGHVFSSDEGLYTVAYDLTYLTALLQCFGFHITVTESGKYGYIIHAIPSPLLENTLENTVNRSGDTAAPPPTERENRKIPYTDPSPYRIQPLFLMQCLLSSNILTVGYILTCKKPTMKTPVLVTSTVLAAGMLLFRKPAQVIEKMIMPSQGMRL